MSYWSDKPRVLWISIFFVFPIAFNILNVRKYGEVEYWFTAIKVVTIVGLIICGLLIAMNVTGTALLGTDNNLRPVPCANNTIGQCLTAPGFGCTLLIHLKILKELTCRLEGGSVYL
jgi:amino acid permease